MSLYVIGDLHLSLSEKVDKPMDIFGDKWENHTEQLRENWCLCENDTAVILGDVSWAMNFSELEEDFAFINSLPGKKLIVKGNHDYWWETLKKMRKFAEKYPTIDFVHNNSYLVDGVNVCGTRGWIAEPNEPCDEKVLQRELGRLKLSLESVKNPHEKVVFLHYPPLYFNVRCEEIMSILKNYGVSRCYYGHLHGKAHRGAIEGEREGILLKCVSADYVSFCPVLVQTTAQAATE